jgi:hypothetical protein
VGYLTAGEIGMRTGGVDAARADFEKCLKLRQELAAANKNSPLARRDLAAILGRLGDVELQWRRDPGQALKHYRPSHEQILALLKIDPKNAENTKDLSQSHYRLGAALQARAEASEAAGHFRECRQMREKTSAADPKNIYKKLELLLARARCGEHAEVAAAEDELAKGTKDPALLYFIGCGYALCSAAVEQGKSGAELTEQERKLKAEYAAKAVRTLSAAVDNGFKDRDALQLDPDLEAIQKDPEHVRLLARLKKR